MKHFDLLSLGECWKHFFHCSMKICKTTFHQSDTEQLLLCRTSVWLMVSSIQYPRPKESPNYSFYPQEFSRLPPENAIGGGSNFFSISFSFRQQVCEIIAPPPRLHTHTWYTLDPPLKAAVKVSQNNMIN